MASWPATTSHISHRDTSKSHIIHTGAHEHHSIYSSLTHIPLCSRVYVFARAGFTSRLCRLKPRAGFLSLWATATLKLNMFCKMKLWSKTWVASELTGSAFALIVVQVVLLNDFSCFDFCFVYGRQFLHCRRCTVGGSWTLFVYWLGHMLENVEIPWHSASRSQGASSKLWHA